jgi:hypothetical protein
MILYPRDDPERTLIANCVKGFARRVVPAVKKPRRNTMKKILSISLMVLMLTATYCFAQTDSGMKGEQKGEMKQPCMKMDDAMMKQMMEKCKPMMKQMMDEKKDMMQMMMDMMTMQEKIIKGPKAAEKKQMMKDMEQMKEKMKIMMSMPMDMTCMDDPQSAEPSKTDPHKH